MKYQDTEMMFLIIVLQLSVTVLGATQDDLLREKVKFLDDLLGDTEVETAVRTDDKDELFDFDEWHSESASFTDRKQSPV